MKMDLFCCMVYCMSRHSYSVTEYLGEFLNLLGSQRFSSKITFCHSLQKLDVFHRSVKFRCQF